MNFFFLSSLFFVLFLNQCFATTSKDDALITQLPRINFQPNFKQYSGYVTVNEATGMNLFYWFVESQNDPANDPLVLWMNGGPGCSSMMGMLEEHGPFLTRPVDEATGTAGLRSNFFAWNRAANVIYVDQPAGVGFSYSDTPTDYNTGDNITAIWTAQFVEKWLEVYPEYQQHDFWITGESYAGVYVPTVAYQILTNTTNTQLQQNLKNGGLMLGNPVTDCNGPGFYGVDDLLSINDQVQMYYWHGMVSPNTFYQWEGAQCNMAKPSNPRECETLWAKIQKQVGPLDQPLMAQKKEWKPQPAALQAKAHIDPDCLYYNYCVGNATLRFTELSNEGCFNVDEQIKDYLNAADVQSALHVKPGTEWTACTGKLHYDRGTSGSIINYLEQFFTIAPTMRILYYSGDIDVATVPFGGTFRCLMTMDRPVKDSWRPYMVNNEIAGYVEIYDTYTLATVKAAGHEAPAYQPASSFAMFTSFLKGEPFPRVIEN